MGTADGQDRVARLLSDLPPPPLPRPLARAVALDIALDAFLTAIPAPPLPDSLAAGLAARIAAEGSSGVPSAAQEPLDRQVADAQLERLLSGLARPRLPGSLAPALVALIGREARAAPAPISSSDPARNPAPLLLVGALLAGLLLLGFTRAWPNLSAGVVVLRALAGGVTPALLTGLLLALVSSVLIVAWPRVGRGARGTRAAPRLGGLALGLSALLVVPSLWLGMLGERVSVGRDVTVRGVVAGDVLSLGGTVRLAPGARVRGQVAAFLGDVQRQPGAQVTGPVSALLGRVEGGPQGETRGSAQVSTQPLPLSGLPGVGTASAFRPLLALLGSLGHAAWVALFLALIAAWLLLLFVSGRARQLGLLQRRAPAYTLALGLLSLSALALPMLALALSGLLGPALVAASLLLLGLSAGLALSLYDAGRALLLVLRVGAPDLPGALLGLTAFGVLTLLPPLALLVAGVGSIWGAGTLLAPGRLAERAG